MSKVGTALAVSVAAVVAGLLPAPAASAAAPVPPGYRLAAAEQLAPGVVHQTLVRRDPDQVVHVARVSRSAKASLRVVRAQPSGGAALERPTSMCARVRCLAAVNGDFFSPATGELVGGMASGGRPVRSPGARHHQLTVGPDGELAVGLARWRTTLVSTDLRSIDVHGINVPRAANQVVVYTPDAGRSTGTNPYGVEVVARVEEPAGPLRLGQTALIRLSAPRAGVGDTPIPRDGVVLSGHGAGARALLDLWSRVRSREASPRALLRAEATPGALESIGGSPVLVRDGRRYVQSTGPSFVTGRHPRTAVGWTAAREVLLVTVDGRQQGYSAGMSLPELADLLIGLGAVEAMNLDGGGSTTFVAHGAVANQPSDRLVLRNGRQGISHLAGSGDRVLGNLERAVGNVLALVPFSGVRGLADPFAEGIELGPAVHADALGDLDPASTPHGALPALVHPPARPIGDALPVVVAVLLLLLVGSGVGSTALRAYGLRTPLS